MLALASVWIAVASLALAAAMLVHRPFFTDLSVTLVLYFGSPGALCFAGLVLWVHRKETNPDAAVTGQRIQAKVATALAILAAAIVYFLVIFAEPIPRSSEPQAAAMRLCRACANVGLSSQPVRSIIPCLAGAPDARTSPAGSRCHTLL